MDVSACAGKQECVPARVMRATGCFVGVSGACACAGAEAAVWSRACGFIAHWMGRRMPRSTGWVVPCPWITGPEDVAGSCLLGYPSSVSPPPSTTVLGQLLPRANSCRCPVWDPVSHLVVSLLGIIPHPLSPPCEINVLAIP